jgi:four helix bundle protein
LYGQYQIRISNSNIKFEFELNSGGIVGEFDPDRMAVYRLTRHHSRAVHALIAKGNVRGHADLVAQLRASTASMPANILEGFGEWRTGKRVNYLQIAKGSTWESWAHIDTMVDFRVIPASSIVEVRDLQRQISALLITMIRNLERGARDELDPPNAPI